MNVFFFTFMFLLFFSPFYFLFLLFSKWDINRRHSFTTRRVSSMALTSNLASKVIFGLLMAVRQYGDLAVARLPPNISPAASSYSVDACSIFLEHLEGRNRNDKHNNVGRK